MINLRDDMPLLCFPGGRTQTLDQAWLCESLLRAATNAGYPEWSLAKDVTISVCTFLKYDFEKNIITTKHIQIVVRTVLTSLNYPDISDRFIPLPAPISLSLEKIARDAGSGYELFFFNLLRENLQKILNSKTEHIDFLDLNRCVKTLRTAKNWRRDCRHLQSEIVTFIRNEIHAAKLDRQLSIYML
ncbi:MAG: hypothetical protein ACK5LK_07135 [Chthoniobacterales bacterium]